MADAPITSTTMADDNQFSPLATSTPAKDPIPNLGNPPPAPTKSAPPLWRPWALEGVQRHLSFDEDEEEEERRYCALAQERAKYETWDVRHKYLYWTPLEVREMDSVSFLHYLHRKYALPSSQPRNPDEAGYLDIMSEEILKRLLALRLNSV